MKHPENDTQYKGLKVNDGVAPLGVVNPYLDRQKRRRVKELTTDEYVAGILGGDVTVLSRAVTLIESLRPEHQEIAREVVERCLPFSGKSVRIGGAKHGHTTDRQRTEEPMPIFPGGRQTN